MVQKLDGKVALVTGAAQGIGAACAQLLAEAGAAVAVADLNAEGGKKTVQAIIDAGGRAIFVPLDVTNEEAWIAAIAQVRAELGGLNVLLNNAGIGKPAPLTEMTMESFRLTFAINVDGMFLGMKHGIPLMTASGGGSIINVSSTAAFKPYANQSAYCASKAGVAQLSKVAALECAKSGIRVNSLHPGIVQTPAWDGLGALKGGDASTKIDVDAMAASTVALGVKGMPADIANAVMYLSSEDSRYVTGTALVVDGGQLLL